MGIPYSPVVCGQYIVLVTSVHTLLAVPLISRASVVQTQQVPRTVYYTAHARRVPRVTRAHAREIIVRGRFR